MGGGFARALIYLTKQRKGRKEGGGLVVGAKVKKARETKGLALEKLENIDQDLYYTRGRWIASESLKKTVWIPITKAFVITLLAGGFPIVSRDTTWIKRFRGNDVARRTAYG